MKGTLHKMLQHIRSLTTAHSQKISREFAVAIICGDTKYSKKSNKRKL